MNLHLQRLAGDWNRLREALRDHPRVQLAGTAGNPPQRYHILYRIKGLAERPDGTLEVRDEHLAEISLLRGYPRQPPVCRMLTPVFHPNIAPHVICIGDQWSAGESLLDLVFRIGEMIAYQSYNIRSPLNGQAAKWVEEHLSELPVDPAPLVLTEAEGAAPAPPSAACAQCRQTVPAATLWQCGNGHLLCARCRAVCVTCGATLCPACDAACSVCFKRYCESCLAACRRCGRPACPAHRDPATGLCAACAVLPRG